MEAAVFDSADLQTMLSEKIALISHTLEVNSPRKQTVTEAAIVDAHKDSESDPSLQPQLTVRSRNSPTPSQIQENTQTLQESQSSHVNTDAPSHSNQPTDSPNLPHSVDDLPSSDIQEVTNNPSLLLPQSFRRTTEGKQFATRLPKLEIPVFTGESLDWQPFWDCFEAASHSCKSSPQHCTETQLSASPTTGRGRRGSKNHCRTHFNQFKLWSLSEPPQSNRKGLSMLMYRLYWTSQASK